MKILPPLALALAVLCLGATTGLAFLDSVSAPAEVTTGKPFTVTVFGSMPDPCWAVMQSQWQAVDGELTLEIFTAFLAPPGVICPTVLEPFVLAREVSLPAPGNWLLRVVEHRTQPNGPPLPDLVREQAITAVGPLVGQHVTWGTLRAWYR